MKKSWCRFCLIVSLLCAAAGVGYAQPTWTFEPFGKEKKPEQYEEKLLPSEKTATKKFTPVRRFIQNNTTHYNFYFNANNRLNAVLERARIANKDDYNQLLPFYGYSLDQTAAQRVELDSVIYKSTAAILLHDLRSDWVDNMYLLIGKSYYLRKQFDSAAMTFQLWRRTDLTKRGKSVLRGRLPPDKHTPCLQGNFNGVMFILLIFLAMSRMSGNPKA